MPEIQQLWFGIYGVGRKPLIKFTIVKPKFEVIFLCNWNVLIWKLSDEIIFGKVVIKDLVYFTKTVITNQFINTIAVENYPRF